jgi:hypothetical protein
MIAAANMSLVYGATVLFYFLTSTALACTLFKLGLWLARKIRRK